MNHSQIIELKSEQSGNYIDVPIDIKGVSDDGTFEGYGSIFDNVDSGRDVVVKGAFTRSLRQHSRKGTKPKLLWQHDRYQPIGVWESLKEDATGLWAKGRLLIKQNVPKADEAYALLKSGAIDGLSIGYGVPVGGSQYDAKKNLRYLKDLDLYEVSLVTFPMNQSAMVNTVKGIDELSPGEITRRSLEAALRDAGASKSVASYIAAHFNEPALRDAGGLEATQLSEVAEALTLLQKSLTELKGLIDVNQHESLGY